VDLDEHDNVRSLVEKPTEPISNLAVPGLYLYDDRVVEMTEGLQPSARGELEITDLNKAYLERGNLVATRLGRGIAWLDSGTHDSLLEASNFIATIEHRQGLKIACLEEIALQTGAISLSEFEALVEKMAQSSYREYLERVVTEST
jgi:glucose-1-phosphate thymidylyltransferase